MGRDDSQEVFSARVLELLKERNASDILFVVGGSILEEDAATLRQMGVDGVFGIESRTDDIVDFVKENARR